MASQIQKETKDGAEVVAFWLGVFRNTTAKLTYRMEAAEWLADHGFGRPAQAVQVTGDEGGPMEVTVVWPDA